ncbi:MAG TPA: S-layer homology domain-containing protein, partial [Bryobacteraceae bacterium]|nr:S-layer homology domain-containing protein [Bryobacteraceae bacterium]
IAGKTFTVSQTQPSASYTVTTSPAGLNVTVDGQSYITPQNFNWTQGSTHTLSVATQGTSPRYVFQSWSDAGAATHTISAPQGGATYTAALTAKYPLTTAITPLNGGTLSVSPASADGYYSSGSTVTLTAAAASGWQFSSWTGSASAAANPLFLTIDAPKTVTASFQQASAGTTIQTSPSGLRIFVDGLQYTAPASFTWTAGSVHTIDAGSTLQTGSARYTFSNWSDGGSRSHQVTAQTGASTYTATFTASYLLLTSVSPASTGSVSAAPSSVDGYYAAGATVQLQAAAASGYQFGTWTGDAAGLNAATSVTMNGPRSATAVFSSVAAAVCTYSLGQTLASLPASGDYRQVNVIAGSGCGWNTLSSADWVHIVSGGSAAGSGSVRILVDPNFSGAARTAFLNIAGLNYDVVQSGSGCTFTLTGVSSVLPYGAGSYSLNVSTPAGCQWSSVSTGGWITLANPSSGSGSGALGFSITANTGPSPRTGAIVVGGQWLPIVQKGSSSTQFFSDVPSSSQFFDYISLLRLNGVSQGCGSNNYCPEDVMTRKEMAGFIIRALMGESFSYSTVPYFTDVPSTDSHFSYIQKMKELGITSGCTLTTYCPDAPVTRGQMAAFLVRGRLGITNIQTFPYAATPYFTDVPAGDMFFPYIQKMKELGITLGCTTTSYCSSDPNTRGQMGPFIIRSFY